MRYSFTLFLVLGCLLCGWSADFKGYLITKNNYHLTGFINSVSVTPFGLSVQFTNDFGNRYDIHPALVRGFAFQDGSNVKVYVSHFYEGHWLFLETVYEGEVLSLFQAPDLEEKWVNGAIRQPTTFIMERFWLKRRQREIYPINRFGFRKQMRRLLGDNARALQDELGKQNFRYRDLLDIVKSYNERYHRSKQRT